MLPADAAEAVHFVATDASAKSTGKIINVDAGNATAVTRWADEDGDVLSGASRHVIGSWDAGRSNGHPIAEAASAVLF